MVNLNNKYAYATFMYETLYAIVFSLVYYSDLCLVLFWVCLFVADSHNAQSAECCLTRQLRSSIFNKIVDLTILSLYNELNVF